MVNRNASSYAVEITVSSMTSTRSSFLKKDGETVFFSNIEDAEKAVTEYRASTSGPNAISAFYAKVVPLP